MFALIKQLLYATGALAVFGYTSLIADVAPNEPPLMVFVLAGCMSFAVIFYLILMTAALNKRLEWIPGRTERDLVLELAKQWVLALTILTCTVLFYTFLYRMGGLRDTASTESALAHDASTCFY